MKRLSPHRRRTLRYAMASTAIVVFLGACVYAVAWDHLSRQIDAELDIKLQALQQQVGSSVGQADLSQKLNSRFGDRSRVDVQVAGANGQLLFQSERLKKCRLPPPAPPANADLDVPTWCDGEVPGLGPVRCISGMVVGQDGPLLVQVAMQIEGLQHKLESLTIILMTTCPLAILVLMVGRYWFSGLPRHQFER